MKKVFVFIILTCSFALSQEVPNSPTSITSPEQIAKQRSQALKQVQYQNSLNMYRYAWGGFGTIGTDHLGLSTFYQKPLKDNWFVLGETGIFHRFNGTDAIRQALEGVSPRYNVYMIPLFIGFRRNLVQKPLGEFFLPFLMAGMGPVLGLEFSNSNQFLPNTNAALTWGAYLGTGADLFLFQGWQTNLNLRYQFTKFNRYLGNWNDFSSWSIGLGFEKRFF